MYTLSKPEAAGPGSAEWNGMTLEKKSVYEERPCYVISFVFSFIFFVCYLNSYIRSYGSFNQLFI